MILSDKSTPIHYIGIDIGGTSSHSAIVACQLINAEDPDGSEIHIIFLKRYSLGTSVMRVVEELHQIWNQPRFGPLCPITVTDCSGNGGAQAYRVIKAKGITPLIPITVISTGKGRIEKGTVPKRALIENLSELFLQGRIKVAKNLDGAELLLDELKGYRRQTSPGGRTIQYRPTGKSGCDDLVDSLSLIVHAATKIKRLLWVKRPDRLYPHSAEKPRPISGNRGEPLSNLSRSLYAATNPDYSDLRGWG